MCGIIGVVGVEQASKALLEGIKSLEYRGYDSVGMATFAEDVAVRKDIGNVQEVDDKLQFTTMSGNIGIAHSRWATHGGVTRTNTHPHQSYNKKVVAVHNGIIENYEVLKKKLQEQGVEFVSETDTEVIPNYIENKIEQGKSIKEAIKDFIAEAEGTFAILLMIKGDDQLYALRRDSPLAIGFGEGCNYVASDIYAFGEKTNTVAYLDNNEWAIIGKHEISFFDKDGTEVQKERKVLTIPQEEEQHDYAHLMLKEIMEEPKVVKRLLLSLETEQKEVIEKLVAMMKSSRKIVFVAAGTSYHASLLGVYFFHKLGVEAQTLIASEFEHFANLDKNSLVIAISQSGETMDVIDALEYSKKKGAKIASFVNVPYSTVQRMSDLTINLLAGKEISVASTKAYVNQVALLLHLAQHFGYEVNLNRLPGRIESVFKKIPKIQQLAKEIHKHNDLYVIGRGLSYPVAREIALKIKEVSYIHAEGMMGGELKHGTIALIEEGTPVISLISNNNLAMVSNTKEVEARGARVITITNELAGDIKLETSNDGKFSILATIVGQLLTYYIALERGLPIDQPRNLAKVVTVR